jgi:hypothetical protein
MHIIQISHWSDVYRKKPNGAGVVPHIDARVKALQLSSVTGAKIWGFPEESLNYIGV